MNTKKIIAELRRSACEDAAPFRKCSFEAFYKARNYAVRSGLFKGGGFFYADMNSIKADDLRTFYLLVAEAMEST